MHQPIAKNTKARTERILHVLFIFCGCLAVWGIVIYRSTIISPKYLFVVAAIGTAVATPFIRRATRGFMHWFWALFIAIVIGGGSAYFFMLFLNRTLADREALSETFVIQKTGNFIDRNRGRCAKPYAIIKFRDCQKQLFFDCAFEESIHDYRSVRVEFSEGLFGFPVLKDQTLVR